MASYHMLNKEKEISEETELYSILERGSFLTLALAKDNHPYLVSMDYAYDRGEHCFFFHCAKKGKKVDYLRANPAVWGQIAEDNGYIEGECSHAYITLQFMGDVEFQTDVETKRKALLLMIDKYEKDPEPMKKRFINETALQGVLIGKIKIQKMTGKQSPAPKKG